MTTPGKRFGFALGGGMGEPSVNPTDPADHGVFITKVCTICRCIVTTYQPGVHYLD